MNIKINDLVVRISYNRDIVFKIIKIEGNTIYLQGVYIRLVADANISDLELVSDLVIEEYDQKERKKLNACLNLNRKRSAHLTGKILHIDGDSEYLEKCLNLYKEVGIPAYGIHLEECDFSSHILDLIYQVDPDIIILTGHDSYNRKGVKNLQNYLNTQSYINAVKEIRKHYSKDHIFIFAGGCQSNYEALIACGCNYASSPKRVNIDIFDPALVAIKAAITPFNQIIDLRDISKTISLDKGLLSGIESYGKMRLLL